MKEITLEQRTKEALKSNYYLRIWWNPFDFNFIFETSIFYLVLKTIDDLWHYGRRAFRHFFIRLKVDRVPPLTRLYNVCSTKNDSCSFIGHYFHKQHASNNIYRWLVPRNPTKDSNVLNNVDVFFVYFITNTPTYHLQV